jgi:hypothetical protein
MIAPETRKKLEAIAVEKFKKQIAPKVEAIQKKIGEVGQAEFPSTFCSDKELTFLKTLFQTSQRHDMNLTLVFRKVVI